jgi:L-threonine kinase
MKPGKGSCNGTFGELVQGVIAERPFLITLPIPSLRSEAVFIPNPDESKIDVMNSKIKAARAGELLLQQFGVIGGGHLEIRSNIPPGKGMASSSADITAALTAIAKSYSLPVTADIISHIAAKIEPTDGVMYEHAVAFDYIHGELIETFGELPQFILVGVDLGGSVNTVEFNQIPKTYNSHDSRAFLKAYDSAQEGFRKKDLSFICKAATISARVNQKILPKPYFREFENLAKIYQGGIVVAHSGTVMGILIDKNQHEVVLPLTKQIAGLFKNKNISLFHYFSNEGLIANMS